MEMLPHGWTPSHVAIDIDGTITDENKLLDGEAINALRRLEKAGIPVILSTGNVRAITYGLWRFIGLSGPICCENGGVLWDSSWDEPLVRADPRDAKMQHIGLQSGLQGWTRKGLKQTDGVKVNGVYGSMNRMKKFVHCSKKSISPPLYCTDWFCNSLDGRFALERSRPRRIISNQFNSSG